MTDSHEAFDLLPAGVLIVRDDIILAANALARDLFGTALQGTSLAALAHGASPLAKGDPVALTLRGPRGDLPVIATAAPAPDGTMIVVFQAHHQEGGKAELAAAAKMRFLASASHDLRQPLQAMALFTSALESRAGEEIKRITDSMKNSLETMERIFERLLDLFRLDAGAFVAHRDDFLASDVLEGLAGQEGVIVVPSGVAVWTDRKLLRRILSVLVRTARGRGSRVLIGCRRRGQVLHFEVWDNGSDGLDQESLDLVAEGSPPDLPADGKIGSDKLDLLIASRLTRLLGSVLETGSGPRTTRISLAVPLSSSEDED